MNNMRFIGLHILLFLCVFVSNAFAQVTATGTFYFNDHTIGNIKDIEYNNSMSFASISNAPNSFNLDKNAIPWNGSGSYGNSFVSGTHNPNTARQTFHFFAASADPENTISEVDVNFNAKFIYTGDIKDFGYSYEYDFNKASDDDVTFSSQIVISYYTGTDWIDVYSDYRSPEKDYDGQKQVNISNPADVNGTSTIMFDEQYFEEFGHQDWYISWDFMAEGKSSRGEVQPYPTPEPGTLALLGFGLAGLGFYAHRRRNKA